MNLIERALAGEKLTEYEWKVLAYSDDDFDDIEQNWEYVDTQEGNDHRWQREMLTVIKYKDKYYGITWMGGLTESIENEFYGSKIFEVEKVPVTTYEWRMKNAN